MAPGQGHVRVRGDSGAAGEGAGGPAAGRRAGRRRDVGAGPGGSGPGTAAPAGGVDAGHRAGGGAGRRRRRLGPAEGRERRLHRAGGGGRAPGAAVPQRRYRGARGRAALGGPLRPRGGGCRAGPESRNVPRARCVVVTASLPALEMK